MALLAPAFTVALMALVRPVASRLAGPIGRLAAGTVARAVSRTGVAAAALMVAVSVTIGVSVMIASFRSTVANWLGLTLVADVYVSAPAPGGARPAAVLSADVPALVAGVPGVAAIETIRLVHVGSPLGEVQLAVTDATRARSAGALPLPRGRPAGHVEARARGRGAGERALRLPARAAGARRVGDAPDRRRPATFPVAGDLLRLRDRAGDRADGARSVRAALGRSRPHVGRGVRRAGLRPGAGDRRRAPGARGARTARRGEPRAAAGGAARCSTARSR